MSGQELIPELQAQETAEDDDIEKARPYYYKPAGKDGKVGPKDEPPASYDEPMIDSQSLHDYQSGYAAHNEAPFTNRQASGGASGMGNAVQREQWQQQQFRSGPDGDAYENQYRGGMNNQRQWSAPPWARPQRQHWSSGQIIALIILALLVGVPLVLSLAGIIIGAVFGVLGMAFGAFIIIGIPFLIIRASIRRSLRRGGPGYWMGYRQQRRGSRRW